MGDETRAQRPDGGLGPVRDTEFGKDIASVSFYRIPTDRKGRSDCLVVEAFRYELKDSVFLAREGRDTKLSGFRRGGRPFTGEFERGSKEGSIDDRITNKDSPDGMGEMLGIHFLGEKTAGT